MALLLPGHKKHEPSVPAFLPASFGFANPSPFLFASRCWLQILTVFSYCVLWFVLWLSRLLTWEKGVVLPPDRWVDRGTDPRGGLVKARGRSVSRFAQCPSAGALPPRIKITRTQDAKLAAAGSPTATIPQSQDEGAYGKSVCSLQELRDSSELGDGLDWRREMMLFRSTVYTTQTPLSDLPVNSTTACTSGISYATQ